MWNRPGIKGLLDKAIQIWCWCWYGIADRVRLCNARRRGWKDYGRVSIIMPTIGRDATKAIQSVLNQTYRNWELIIVQDGKDNLLNKFWNWESHDLRVYEYSIPKEVHYPLSNPIYQWLVGPVNAINYGLSKVQGAWIARIDDDDEWEPNHLKEALVYAAGFKREFVSFDIDLNGSIPKPYKLYNKNVGAVQTWLYRSYLKCFKCSKHSWRWRPGNNDIDLPKRMARAGVKMVWWNGIHAIVKPRPGLTETGKKGWMQDVERQNILRNCACSQEK